MTARVASVSGAKWVRRCSERVSRTLGAALATLLAACASQPPQAERSQARPVESADDIARMCELTQCGHDIRIVLKDADGSILDKTFDALPVIQQDSVSVYAGQTVLFEAELDGNRLVRLKRVDRIEHPERTLSSRLEQDDSGHMMLTTHNPFGKHLRIRMGMMPLEHDGLVPTSSCPVVAKGASFEMWPYPIFQIWLGDLRLLEETEAMNCVE